MNKSIVRRVGGSRVMDQELRWSNDEDMPNMTPALVETCFRWPGPHMARTCAAHDPAFPFLFFSLLLSLSGLFSSWHVFLFFLVLFLLFLFLSPHDPISLFPLLLFLASPTRFPLYPLISHVLLTWPMCSPSNFFFSAPSSSLSSEHPTNTIFLYSTCYFIFFLLSLLLLIHSNNFSVSPFIHLSMNS